MTDGYSMTNNYSSTDYLDESGNLVISPMNSTLETAYQFRVDVFYDVKDPTKFITMKEVFSLVVGCNIVSQETGLAYIYSVFNKT